MKVGIIDLGTNTFNLLVVEVNEARKFRTLYQNRIAVMLGHEGMTHNTLSNDAIQRGINALKQFSDKLIELKVERVHAKATSAIRESMNGEEFVNQVKKQCGIAIDVISGEEEARLIYEGVKKALPLQEEPSLIMDIGGGSTEFVLANKRGVLWKKSFLLGVARLNEIICPSDPITKEEIIRLNELLKLELAALTEQVEKHKPFELIGVSGVFESYADIIQHYYNIKTLEDGQTSYEFNIDQFKQIGDLLTKSKREERLVLNGLIEMRVDMIVVSQVLINYVLSRYNITSIRMSTYSMKEGVLCTLK